MFRDLYVSEGYDTGIGCVWDWDALPAMLSMSEAGRTAQNSRVRPATSGAVERYHGPVAAQVLEEGGQISSKVRLAWLYFCCKLIDLLLLTPSYHRAASL